MDGTQQKEYAFEMAASSIRFGPGCTKEVGMDLKNMGAKRVMVVTDGNVRKLQAMKQTVEALDREGVQYEIFDKVRVEPKDSSIKEANEFSKAYRPDAFLAVGGGSVIDTAKLMNLYTTFPGGLTCLFRKAQLLMLCRSRFPRFRQCPAGQGQTNTFQAIPSHRGAYNGRDGVRDHGHRHLRSCLETCKDWYCAP